MKAPTKDKSIHPRVWRGGEKVNTCKPQNNAGKPYTKKAARLNRRQLACDATRKSMKGGNPLAFRMPGSMK